MYQFSIKTIVASINTNSPVLDYVCLFLISLLEAV